jgi:hypothetical protein
LPLFTVAICTRNRAASLARALSSLAAATRPREPFEVLVVLNASTDGSVKVVEKEAGRLPVRAVVEPKPGLSHARNRAVAEAHGDVLVFIDDDVEVGRHFLTAYAAAFLGAPLTEVFAGPVVPRFEGEPPSWLPRVLPTVGSAYALQRVDRDGAPIVPTALPYGCNLAIRVSAHRGCRYDPELGRGPPRWLRGGEETVVLANLFAAGASGQWVAGATVDHIISQERQTRAYLWRYYEGYGRVLALLDRRRGSERAMTAAMVELIAADLTYKWARLVSPPEQWSVALVRAATRRGRWQGRSG